MKSKKTTIQKINYGELHIYYPLKFSSKQSYEKICESIKLSSLIFKQSSLKNVLQDSNSNLDNISSSVGDPAVQSQTVNIGPSPYKDHTPNLNINQDNANIKILVKDSNLEVLHKKISSLQNMYGFSRKIYGNTFSNTQNRFLLLPLKIELYNHKSTWLYPLLYIFENKMAVLKFELPLIDCDPSPLLKNNYNLLIKKVTNLWNISNYHSETTFSELKEFYIYNLKIVSKTFIDTYNNSLKNIILADFDGMPQTSNCISPHIQEALFSIICAPVPLRPNISYRQEAIDYFNNFHWGGHGINYIVKSTGGFLSWTDKETLDYCDSPQEIASSLSYNLEFALLILLLKKTIKSIDYFTKIANKYSYSEAQAEYNKNIIFLSKLQESCYGTASQQVLDFEKMMPYYFNSEITLAKQNAINEILQKQEQQKTEHFQSFASVLGLVFASGFGLPSIYDTLKILQRFLSNDIPYLTLNNASLILWIIMLVIMIWNFFKYR